MNKVTIPKLSENESTYALLVRSEEKMRNVLELAIYPLLIAAGIMAIVQFAQQTINIPPPTAAAPASFVNGYRVSAVC